MGVHEDTLQGLQDMLEYAKGNKEKGRLRTMEPDITPEEQRELQTIISSEESTAATTPSG